MQTPPAVQLVDRYVMPRTCLAVSLLLAPVFSGCIGENSAESTSIEEEHWLPRVEDRSNLIYRDDDVFSRVSSNGSYPIDTVRSIFIPVPEITVSDGGAGALGGAEVHLGLWLPVIEGCDMDSSCLLYTSPSPRDVEESRMPSSA